MLIMKRRSICCSITKRKNKVFPFIEAINPARLNPVATCYNAKKQTNQPCHNKEAAAILGISYDSVKKTRARLRKRLGIDDKIYLDEFVHQF